MKGLKNKKLDTLTKLIEEEKLNDSSIKIKLDKKGFVVKVEIERDIQLEEEK